VQVLDLQKDVIYGPVDSRRLRKSLGINLLPVEKKVCTFDCIYCHYGRTTVGGCRASFPPKELVIPKIERAFKEMGDVDYFTFSGNGEPTLHPDFDEIVNETVALRDEHAPDIPLALLSNASRAGDANIRKTLENIDVCIMKLDAGDERTFNTINRPHAVSFREICSGLKQLSPFILQCVMVDGICTNSRGTAFDQWIDMVSMIKPQEIQIYSTDRPVAIEGVTKVGKKTLTKRAHVIEGKTGITVRVY
jgi:wyosine [tRNA(Phe)-imidazoG37] synthetase (radical SAM superfamily)